MMTTIAHTWGSNVLMYPYAGGFSSRLMNMKKLAHILVEDGYTVTILLSSDLQNKNSDKLERNDDNIDTSYYTAPGAAHSLSYLNTSEKLLLDTPPKEVRPFLLNSQLAYCDAMFSDKNLMRKVKEITWDLLFFDASHICSRLLRDYVDVPSVAYSNSGFGLSDLFFPLNLAYMPMFFRPYSHRMTFLQRLRNVVDYLTITFSDRVWYDKLNQIKLKYDLNNSLSIYDAFKRVDLVFVNTDFSYDFSRLTMPNSITIGGIFYQSGTPIERTVGEFADKAKEGLVVVSFGSMVGRMKQNQVEILAEAFGKLNKLRFVWRYVGTPPVALANNTLLVPWLPQEALLNHSNTVAFVSHCGVSSVQEAVYHVVPVFALPLFLDQGHQASKLVQNGMASKMDIHQATSESLSMAISELITNKEYKQNAKKVQYLMLNQPIHPRQKFILWVNYVIKNQGASHLKSTAIEQLSWFQYFLLDIIIFVLACLGLPLYCSYRLLIKLR